MPKFIPAKFPTFVHFQKLFSKDFVCLNWQKFLPQKVFSRKISFAFKAPVLSNFIKVNPFYQELDLKKPDMDRCSSSLSTSSSGDICRICHCEAEKDDPLISPCICSGSLMYIHQACLQKWIKATDTKSCELCKYEFHIDAEMKPINKVSILCENSNNGPFDFPKERLGSCPNTGRGEWYLQIQ